MPVALRPVGLGVEARKQSHHAVARFEVGSTFLVAAEAAVGPLPGSEHLQYRFIRRRLSPEPLLGYHIQSSRSGLSRPLAIEPSESGPDRSP